MPCRAVPGPRRGARGAGGSGRCRPRVWEGAAPVRRLRGCGSSRRGAGAEAPPALREHVRGRAAGCAPADAAAVNRGAIAALTSKEAAGGDRCASGVW